MTKQYVRLYSQIGPNQGLQIQTNLIRRRFQPAWWQILLLILLCGFGAWSSRAASSDKTLKVSTKNVGGVTHFYVQNLDAADMTATFEMNLVNLKCSAALPCTLTVAGNQTAEAFAVSPVDHNVPWSYRYTDSYTIGSATAQHDDTSVYLLPYAAGETFRVSQGYHGAFSHTGPDEYAIDWKMPPGTPVHAARAGVVVQSKDDSNVGGPSRKYQSCANCVLIRHSDGTIGIYAHLQKGGNRVKVGDHVNAGDWIALSGNTGFTSGPHLHFSVFKTKSGMERESIPVKFQTANGPALTLLAGQSYQSAPLPTSPAHAPTTLAVATQGRKKG